ncbi:MAG: hypothetical protein AAB551_04710 [Patescibacteria group bacterium]
MQQTIKNFITVSFILFAIIGTAYLFSTLFAENEIYTGLSQQIQKFTELPFFIVTILYFGSILIEPLVTPKS